MILQIEIPQEYIKEYMTEKFSETIDDAVAYIHLSGKKFDDWDNFGFMPDHDIKVLKMLREAFKKSTVVVPPHLIVDVKEDAKDITFIESVKELNL